jgi:hypothetical protein
VGGVVVWVVTELAGLEVAPAPWFVEDSATLVGAAAVIDIEPDLLDDWAPDPDGAESEPPPTELVGVGVEPTGGLTAVELDVEAVGLPPAPVLVEPPPRGLELSCADVAGLDGILELGGTIGGAVVDVDVGALGVVVADVSGGALVVAVDVVVTDVVTESVTVMTEKPLVDAAMSGWLKSTGQAAALTAATSSRVQFEYGTASWKTAKTWEPPQA